MIAAVDAWTKAGAVAAVLAAAAGIAAVVISRRSLGDARKAVMYERLREARELVSKIKVTGDNARFAETNEAAAQLRSVVVAIGVPLPLTLRLAETEWELDAYSDPGLTNYVRAARAELEEVTRSLTSSSAT